MTETLGLIETGHPETDPVTDSLGAVQTGRPETDPVRDLIGFKKTVLEIGPVTDLRETIETDHELTDLVTEAVESIEITHQETDPVTDSLGAVETGHPETDLQETYLMTDHLEAGIKDIEILLK